MPTQSIHQYLAHLVPDDAQRVLDLGCGRGATLVEIALARPAAALVGLDRNEQALIEAASTVALADSEPEFVAADASSGVPFPDARFDCVVCHNVLECLENPLDTINEINRVLRVGGEAILSHTDFGTLVFNSTLPALTRQAVELYADHTPRWTQYADGLIGRKLPALVHASSLETIDVTSHTTLSLRFVPGEKGYERATKELAPLLPPDEAERWLEDLEAMDQNDAFFSSENAYVVRAMHIQRPESSQASGVSDGYSPRRVRSASPRMRFGL